MSEALLTSHAPGRALWLGQWLTLAELDRRLESLPSALRDGPSTSELVARLLEAAGRLATRAPELPPLRAALLSGGLTEDEAQAALSELSTFLSPESLRAKLTRELGGGDAARLPHRFERIEFKSETPVFEAWAPLGVLLHVAPTNAANVPFLSVIEGLLTGNVNFVKLGSDDTDYPLLCLAALLDADPTGLLAGHVAGARFPSSDEARLRRLAAVSDGVVAWGSEEAVESLRRLTPSHARFIDWGPKISIAYVGRGRLEDTATLEAIARAAVELEQQACSSPQVVYLDLDPETEAPRFERFARALAQALARQSAATPRAQEPSPAEQAELTKVRLIAESEAGLPDAGPLRLVFPEERGDWLLLAEPEPTLKASPLYRSLWLKPLPEGRIVETLRPFRAFLQTVGLAADHRDFARLSAAFFRAGALRVTPPGRMLAGYEGEPHDGVYALQRYSRRLSVQGDATLACYASLDELRPREAAPAGRSTTSDRPSPLTTKAMLASRPVDLRAAHLHFKSGGSSGEPQLSIYSYDDYHRQMRQAAQGLLAAGLEPGRDRCMNLFFAGGLYGGFLSFFTILEDLRAIQFPMGAHLDFVQVARTIADRRIDTLLGMPSYLAQLFSEDSGAESSGALLRHYGGVRKIFFGGEHFPEAQRERLRRDFGVALIRSAAYGSNDIGPMGFQCPECTGSIHHLLEEVQRLEILSTERDEPVTGDSVGRLVFTSRAREGQQISRYEIGDLGRWVAPGTPCACGRTSPRFELLGRYGDVFKTGSMLLSYPKFVAAASRLAGFAGELQLRIEPAARAGGSERLIVRVSAGPDATDLRTALLEGYPDLREVVEGERLLALMVEPCAPSELERTGGSGKLRHVIDTRLGAGK